MDTTRRIGRRSLLKRTAAAAGALAAPYLIPSGLLAAAGRPGPNDRIGVAGIGVGRQGSGVFRAAAGSPLGRPIAVADANIRRAGEIAAKIGIEPYQDYRKLLERKDVDAITTATPDHWRALVSIHACQAGKDVYAEKPMSLTIREGRLMVETVRKYGRVFQTGSQQRSQAENRFGCELVRNGRIGTIHAVIGANYPSPWECALPAQPLPDGLDWDMWCGPTEPVPYHIDLCTPRANPGWISFRAYSGGEMTGWGAHGLDQIQWALGMDDTGPVEIWTEGPEFDPPVYREPESRSRGEKLCGRPMIFYRYANRVTVKLDSGNPGGGIFIGDKGKIEIFRGKVTSNPPEVVEEPIRDDEIHLYESTNHIGNWLECIKSREKPIADVEIGHRSTTVCHLGNIARWVGRKLQWDPVKEVFPGDEEANAYLDRPRRKGYQLPERI
ncbi:MAG: Gfo/Idh/MocA family oxidoreductase [Thermoguttaceae bacterium]|nr:Gfo/Idh/MocA family oxidoreductase [Thermoguttaceae bacterium]MDI9444047.1 Gfo/Idh/MocA family oxidoreductase [Planctomycetota bacterium]